MPHLFIILLKINLVLLLFAAAYYLVLRRLTFYVLNRCFLVFGIVFSTAYPFIDLTDVFQQQKVVKYLPQLNQKAAELVPTGFFINNWPILSSLFYVGVLFMTVRLIVQFVSLYNIHRKSNPSTVANYKVRRLQESISPFSFWQTIYVNPNLHTEKELDTILAHETVHVKQWHSLDIILAELSVVFYWFNPGVWLMKKAVKENLEFITDQKILKRGMDKKAYQYSLLGVGQLSTSVTIANNFNLSDLKKRILMMNVKRSSKITLSRYVLVLPVLLLTTLAFTVSKKEVKARLPQLAKIIPQLAIEEEKPKAIAAPMGTSKTVKLIKVKTPETGNKPDTSFTFKYIVNAIIIKKDSLGLLKDSEEVMESIKKSLDITNIKPRIKGVVTGFLIRKDKDTLEVKPPVSSNEIVVVGYKRANDKEEGALPKAGKKATMVFKGVKLTDSASTKDRVQYIINGNMVQLDDLSKVNPNEISKVDVIKNIQGNSQIRIEMKKKAEL